MTDAVVMTSLISLALVAVASLMVAAVAIKKSSDRFERNDRVMADLLKTVVNAAVVSESDQVPRIEAENGHESPDLPKGAFSSVPDVPGSRYETFGAERNDPMD